MLRSCLDRLYPWIWGEPHRRSEIARSSERLFTRFQKHSNRKMVELAGKIHFLVIRSHFCVIIDFLNRNHAQIDKKTKIQNCPKMNFSGALWRCPNTLLKFQKQRDAQKRAIKSVADLPIDGEKLTAESGSLLAYSARAKHFPFTYCLREKNFWIACSSIFEN